MKNVDNDKYDNMKDIKNVTFSVCSIALTAGFNGRKTKMSIVKWTF